MGLGALAYVFRLSVRLFVRPCVRLDGSVHDRLAVDF